jgi:hypothetical protein
MGNHITTPILPFHYTYLPTYLPHSLPHPFAEKITGPSHTTEVKPLMQQYHPLPNGFKPQFACTVQSIE